MWGYDIVCRDGCERERVDEGESRKALTSDRPTSKIRNKISLLSKAFVSMKHELAYADICIFTQISG